MKDDYFGVKCNVTAPNNSLRLGCMCWVLNPNVGNASDRIEVVGRTRYGKLCRTWIGAKLLTNFRVAWMPDHILRMPNKLHAPKDYWSAWADQMNAKAKLIYEDQLPKDMPDSEYKAWFEQSSIVDGVRMGPLYPCQPTT